MTLIKYFGRPIISSLSINIHFTVSHNEKLEAWDGARAIKTDDHIYRS